MSRRNEKNILFRFLMALSVVSLLGLSSAQAQTTPTSFSGDATGVIANANVLGTVTTNVRVAQTGALPSTGGSLQGDVASANIQLGALGTLSSLSTGVIQTRTSGGAAGGTPNSSQSNATVNNLNLLLLGGTLNTINVTATTVQSATLCSCGANGPTCSGTTTIENLRVNNVLVTATAIVMPAPNTVIIVPLLDVLGVQIGTVTLTLNQQTSNGNGDITVNALRIQVTALNGTVTTNIIIAQSHSDITCGPVTTGCTPTTTVAEGDLFPGGISTFGVTSGPGSVTVDHINSGTGLRSFTVVSATNAIVTIPAYTPGTYDPVTATYTVVDPALPVDFTLRAASTYHAVFIRVRCTSVLNTFSGRAIAVNATIAGVNATLADTGP
ncbi:MAG: choice-of-anchor P family protein, partial [Pyrinomonadaceae bacterium]